MSDKPSRISRRDFLKTCSVAAGGLALALAPAAVQLNPVNAAGTDELLFKGTRDGRILVSRDGGLTWETAANFGAQFQVTSVERVLFQPLAGKAQSAKYTAHLSLNGLPVELKSNDGLSWFTLNFKPPQA